MTVADSALSAGNVAAPKPTSGQGNAAEITAATPLPDGWASFCSKPDSQNRSYWYASAPWNVDKLTAEFGQAALDLERMVEAPTWVALHKAVAKQVQIYEELMHWRTERGQAS